jgi:hypothetical protein
MIRAHATASIQLDGTTFTGRYASEQIPRGAVIDSAKLSSGMRLSSFEGFAISTLGFSPAHRLRGSICQ